MSEGSHDLSTSNNSGEWIPISHGFSCDNNIRLDSVILESPYILADSAEAGLHLVRYHEPTILPGNLCQSLEISLRQWHHSSNTQYGLDPHACYFMVTCRCHSFIGLLDKWVYSLVWVPPQVGISDGVRDWHLRHRGCPCAHIGQTVCIPDDSVVWFIESVYVLATRIETGQ